MLAAGLTLAACGGTPGSVDIISQKNVVVQPPSALLQCDVPTLPDKFSSHNEVADSYVNIYSELQKCHQNSVALQKFYNDAGTIIK